MLRKIYHCVVLVLSIFHTDWRYICTYNMRTNLHTMLSVWLCSQLDAAVFEYFACNLLAIYVCHVLRENVTCIGMWLIIFFFIWEGAACVFSLLFSEFTIVGTCDSQTSKYTILTVEVVLFLKCNMLGEHRLFTFFVKTIIFVRSIHSHFFYLFYLSLQLTDNSLLFMNS